MKGILKMFMAAALMCMPVITFAQERSDKELSAEYKAKIDICNNEIRTIKAKQKLDKTNTDLSRQLIEKKAELTEYKSKKKILDDAIKSKAAQEKAEKKAAKAKQKAESAAAKAKSIKTGY